MERVNGLSLPGRGVVKALFLSGAELVPSAGGSGGGGGGGDGEGVDGADAVRVVVLVVKAVRTRSTKCDAEGGTHTASLEGKETPTVEGRPPRHSYRY